MGKSQYTVDVNECGEISQPHISNQRRIMSEERNWSPSDELRRQTQLLESIDRRLKPIQIVAYIYLIALLLPLCITTILLLTGGMGVVSQLVGGGG